MTTFFIGLLILFAGGAVYGRICEKVFSPDNRPTPAIRLNDGVDFVPMKKWRNSLIQLLNIAGTGPVIGPIQGIIFGPIAFITIPIGCVFGGALHDYMSAMISVRNGGAQMPALVGKYLDRRMQFFYRLFVCLLLVLLGTVFIYTPGDLLITQALRIEPSFTNPICYFVYFIIFAYFLIATLFPVDKLIGRIYPVFGAILILSAIGIFLGILLRGYPLYEIWDVGIPRKNFIPLFFVTVACGIVSGFHGTQSTIVSRTIEHEKDGRMCFYNMMIVEGFIAMCWAAAAMGIMNLGLADADTSASDLIGIIAANLLGHYGSIISVLSVIILGITSGDTALRSLRLILADAFHQDQSKISNRLRITACIFLVVAALLIFSKVDENGFTLLWRYFAWANQTLAAFTFTVITMYLARHKKPFIMALIPAAFYMYVISSFILNAQIGFQLSWRASYILAGILTAVYSFSIFYFAKKAEKKNNFMEQA